MSERDSVHQRITDEKESPAAYDAVEKWKGEVAKLKAQLDHVRVELAIMKDPFFPEIKCAAPGCANMFRPRRRDHTICSDTCRKAISRARKKEAIRSPDAREA